MRVIAFIQDTHSIKDIRKSQGIPDFQAQQPIPKFIDVAQAIDEPLRTTPSSRLLMASKIRFLGDGMRSVKLILYFSQLSSPSPALLAHLNLSAGASDHQFRP